MEYDELLNSRRIRKEKVSRVEVEQDSGLGLRRGL